MISCTDLKLFFFLKSDGRAVLSVITGEWDCPLLHKMIKEASNHLLKTISLKCHSYLFYLGHPTKLNIDE